MAATAPGAGHSEIVLLIQIVILLATGRLLGEIMQRIGQPAVMGQLLAGVLLGPSLLGAVWPQAELALFPRAPEQKAMLDAIAQLGILLLLLLTGMETDLKLVRKVSRPSLAIAATGLAIPFACGFTLGELLPASLLPNPDLRLITSLFLGTALSISSVKIVALVVRELNFMRRNIGQVIIAAAIIEDTIGWIIIAIIFGIAAHGSLDLAAIGRTLLGTAIFLAASFTIGRRIAARLIRWANDSFISELPVITAILLMMGVMALATDAIGVHTVLGAFVAGMLIGQSPILTRHIDEQLRGLITALFMPIFFAVAGLGTDLTIIADVRLFALTVGLIAIASIGKFAGAFIGGRLGGLDNREALAIGCGMNARGSTEVVVASIGLSMGALSQDLYTMIVSMAVLTTLAMPPMLRWALARLPMRPDEQSRLEREASEQKGFIAQFERLLLATDDSVNARFAAHLAGFIAGPRQIMTTVLQIETSSRPGHGGIAAPVEDAIRASAQSAQSNLPNPDDEPHDAIDVIPASGNPQQSASASVAHEARKGYDLMMIGAEPTSNEDGMISRRVSSVGSAYEGPLAIVDARGAHRQRPAPQQLSILLPIRATHQSRHGAEMAIAIARSTRSRIEALYVSDRADRVADTGWGWKPVTTLTRGLEEETALNDVVKLAEQNDVTITTSVQRGGNAASAIISAAKSSGHDLIVLGVSRRLGDRLSFGKVAAEVLQAAPCSVLLVSS